MESDLPEKLNEDFAAKLPAKLDELASAMSSGKDNPKELDRALLLSHRLRGTAGALGFPDVGDFARSIEDALMRISEGAPRSNYFWENAWRSLREAIRFARSGPESQRLTVRPGKIHRRPLLVIDDDEDYLRLLRTYARRQSMSIVTAQTVEEGMVLASRGLLCGVMVDVHLASQSGFSAAEKIRTIQNNPELPVIFASVDGTLDTRIAAVQAGANRFLDKPLSEQKFAELFLQVPFAEAQAARIVILDDDEIVLEKYKCELEAEQYFVKGISDPSELVHVLDDVRPDALLLDVNLGKMSGIDICKALRCSERWQFLPILMFSGDKDAEMRVSAYQAGATDVLGKPLSVQELMTRVSVQADRIRSMRDRSDRDALSGLMLRRAFVETMQRCMATCAREKKLLSLVLIDIDHFKHINDQHGHLTGDRVIATFGEVLRNRFRIEDLRARWGGEEFILAFPGQGAEFAAFAARKLLTEVSTKHFEGEDGTSFQVTFTAGVAQFPDDGESLDLLVKRADEHLYEGKAQGRARVVQRPADETTPT